MQTARISNAACTAAIATTVENAKKMRWREGYFYDGHSERSERARSGLHCTGEGRRAARETMSNRTNIDLEALYCPTARWESIL